MTQTAKQHDKPDGRHSKLGYAFTTDMVEIGAKFLSDFADIDNQSAEQIAHHLAEELRKHWGGSQLYIPKTSIVQLHKRDLDIYNQFTGNNVHELGREYNLSEVTIYQIIAKVRKSLPKDQPSLF